MSKFLRGHTNGCATADLTGSTIRAMLDELCGKFPHLRQCLFHHGEQSQVRRFMHVLVNGHERRSAAELALEIHDGDEIILVPDVA